MSAYLAYLRATRRKQCVRQIKRAVRLLGERTEHGWIVLTGGGEAA